MEIIIIIALIIAGISLYEYFTARRWQQVTSNDRNDIVFADRNKEYGAFVLRTGYDRTMSIILFSVFASFALAFGIYKFVKNLPEDEVKGPKLEMIKKTIQTSKKRRHTTTTTTSSCTTARTEGSCKPSSCDCG